MNKERIKRIIVITLMVIEVCTIHLTYKSFINKPVEIDDVKLLQEKESNSNNKSVAIMINEGDGEYKPSSESTFPKVGYIFNEEKSGCIDSYGKQIFGGGYIL